MKFATISAVFALGAVAACAGVPAETRVTSYGDAVPSTVSQPATSTDDPAQKSAADVIAEARAAAVRAETEEKAVPGDLAFSPTPQVSAEDEPNTQVASLPRQDPEPATEAPVNLLKQEPEPATEAPVTLLKQDPEPEAPVATPAGVATGASGSGSCFSRVTGASVAGSGSCFSRFTGASVAGSGSCLGNDATWVFGSSSALTCGVGLKARSPGTAFSSVSARTAAARASAITSAALFCAGSSVLVAGWETVDGTASP